MAGVEEESEVSQEAGLTAAEDGQARDVWKGRERDGGENGEGADRVRGGSKGIGRGAEVCGESRECVFREEREIVEGVGGKHREKKEEVEVEVEGKG